MATYNGARHLEEQIDSILSQTDQDWTLFVHDDGSTDATPDIISQYATRHDNIKVLDYPPQHGACANFLSMVQQVDADYYLFADQDDEWLKEKVELTRAEMRKQEAMHPGKPVVVHTDLYVADSEMHIIDESFMNYTGIHLELLTTFDECVIPFVTGSTMMFNAETRRHIRFPADAAVMHDIWVTLCTLADKGVVSAVNKPLVRYRQHGLNAVGARDVKTVTLVYRLKNLFRILRNNQAHYRMLRSLGYGSVWKYIRYKKRYRDRANQR